MTTVLPSPSSPSRRDQLRSRRNGAAATPVVRIAIPSKGMEEQTLEFLANCGMKVSRPNPRQYVVEMRWRMCYSVVEFGLSERVD